MHCVMRGAVFPRASENLCQVGRVNIISQHNPSRWKGMRSIKGVDRRRDLPILLQTFVLEPDLTVGHKNFWQYLHGGCNSFHKNIQY